MDKNKIIIAIIGIIIGSLIGSLISKHMIQYHIECSILKRENQMLRNMLIQQQETIIMQDNVIPDSLQWYEQ